MRLSSTHNLLALLVSISSHAENHRTRKKQQMFSIFKITHATRKSSFRPPSALSREIFSENDFTDQHTRRPLVDGAFSLSLSLVGVSEWEIFRNLFRYAYFDVRLRCDKSGCKQIVRSFQIQIVGMRVWCGFFALLFSLSSAEKDWWESTVVSFLFFMREVKSLLSTILFTLICV